MGHGGEEDCGMGSLLLVLRLAELRHLPLNIQNRQNKMPMSFQIILSGSKHCALSDTKRANN